MGLKCPYKVWRENYDIHEDDRKNNPTFYRKEYCMWIMIQDKNSVCHFKKISKLFSQVSGHSKEACDVSYYQQKSDKE